VQTQACSVRRSLGGFTIEGQVYVPKNRASVACDPREGNIRVLWRAAEFYHYPSVQKTGLFGRGKCFGFVVFAPLLGLPDLVKS